MRKIFVLLFLSFTSISVLFAQQINIDSIVKVVSARNPRKANNTIFNKDSLLQRLPDTPAGAQRIQLIYDIFYTDIYADSKIKVDVGYQILAWAKSHHDLISEAVICAELGSELASNGDKATGQQLELEAMAAAIQANDKQALGIVYQNSFNRTDFSTRQMWNYSVEAIKLSTAANDKQRVSWEYYNLSLYYKGANKAYYVKYFTTKALDWAIQANSVYDICLSLAELGLASTDRLMAEKYEKGAYAIAALTNDAPSLVATTKRLAIFYSSENKIDSAFIYASKVYQITLHSSLIDQVAAADIMRTVYTQKRNIDSALKYTKLYHELNEKLNNNKSLILAQAITFAEQQKQQQAEIQKTALKNTLELWLLVIIIGFLLLIAFIFWRNDRQSQKTNALLASQKQATELALEDLKAAQMQLVQSEKMASLGELTAGIAHEIQNPLNFVNNFSEINAELIIEMNEELEKGDYDEAKAIANDIKENQQKITQHGKRADLIIKGMLQHSRTSTGERQLTNINLLADEFLKLSYHGMRAKDKNFNTEITTHFDDKLMPISIVQQDISRVLLNLLTMHFMQLAKNKKRLALATTPK